MAEQAPTPSVREQLLVSLLRTRLEVIAEAYNVPLDVLLTGARTALEWVAETTCTPIGARGGYDRHLGYGDAAADQRAREIRNKVFDEMRHLT